MNYSNSEYNLLIRLEERLWIGDSSVSWRETRAAKIGAVLNVAQDLRSGVGWPDAEYMQVGLIDGPGNPMESYYAAVFALTSLLDRHRTLVCCHTGSRSIIVAGMYLNVVAEFDWSGLMSMLDEKVEVELPVPHDAHLQAFKQINWRLIRGIR